jgi:hypothetical protein
MQYYLKYNTTYKIIQAPLYKIDESVLYEKYPIVVFDRLVKPEELLTTLFKYKYLFKSAHPQKGSPFPYIAMNKYTIIYNNKADLDLNIVAPQYKKEFQGFVDFQANKDIHSTNSQYVTIKLKKQQVLIIPPFWIYQSNLPYHVISLNDPFSLLIIAYYSTIARP